VVARALVGKDVLANHAVVSIMPSKVVQRSLGRLGQARGVTTRQLCAAQSDIRENEGGGHVFNIPALLAL
jgi:hypothetical protein